MNENYIYKKIKLLGEGSYGKAYLVECLKDHTQCVIKRINLKDLSEEEKKHTFDEARILELLNHQNIIRFREVYRSKGEKLCIVMDYADGGDLYDKISGLRQGEFFPESQILDWFSQLVSAVQHVHEKKIIHRDLKSKNVFLTTSNTIKLGDFGIARILRTTNEKAKTMVGTPYYLSPEVIEGKAYTAKADIWSLGVILYELCCLKPPFNAQNIHALGYKITKGSYASLPNKYSSEIKKLVALLLQVDPAKRPNAFEILNLPLFIKPKLKQENQLIRDPVELFLNKNKIPSSCNNPLKKVIKELIPRNIQNIQNEKNPAMFKKVEKVINEKKEELIIITPFIENINNKNINMINNKKPLSQNKPKINEELLAFSPFGVDNKKLKCKNNQNVHKKEIKKNNVNDNKVGGVENVKISIEEKLRQNEIIENQIREKKVEKEMKREEMRRKMMEDIKNKRKIMEKKDGMIDFETNIEQDQDLCRFDSYTGDATLKFNHNIKNSNQYNDKRENEERNNDIEKKINYLDDEERNICTNEPEIEKLEKEFEEILFKKKQNLDKKLNKNIENHIDPEINQIISEIDAIVNSVNEITFLKNKKEMPTNIDDKHFVSTKEILEFKLSDEILNDVENIETKENLFFLEIS